MYFIISNISFSLVCLSSVSFPQKCHKAPLQFQAPLSLHVRMPFISLSLEVFGCVCYVHISNSNHHKLMHKALKCVFWLFFYEKMDFVAIILLLDEHSPP